MQNTACVCIHPVLRGMRNDTFRGRKRFWDKTKRPGEKLADPAYSAWFLAFSADVQADHNKSHVPVCDSSGRGSRSATEPIQNDASLFGVTL